MYEFSENSLPLSLKESLVLILILSSILNKGCQRNSISQLNYLSVHNITSLHA